jgi:hypothetical protein
MEGTLEAFRRCSVAVIVLSIAAVVLAPVTSAVAGSTTTTVAAKIPPTCGVVASSQVRVVTTDGLCTVRTHVGANVRIVLRSGWRWSPPLSSSPHVTVTKIFRSSIGPDGATLHAVSAGNATIHVEGTIYCAPGKACPELAMIWSLKVVVTKSLATPKTLRLNASDSGHFYTVHSGERFIVTLKANSLYAWTEPRTMGTSAVQRTSGQAGVTATAFFVATKTGKSMVVAMELPSCSVNCLSPTRLFWVNLNVIA